jgi:recombination protein RecT
MNAQTNLPATQRELSPIEALKGTIAKKADEFKAVLPAHISIEKFQRTIATAALQNPKLLECDRKSLLMAAMKAGQDGLLPDGREAALVPFKVNRKIDGEWQTWWEVQYLPMAWGLRKKVLQSGEVISLETGVIYRAEVEGGHFIYEVGMDPPMRYRPKLDLTLEETADSEIVASYSIARLKNVNGGDPYWSVEVLRRFEIDKIRQMSQTGAVGRVDPRTKRPIEPKGPWVDWLPAMAEKSALRQHTKVLPQSGDLLDSISRDDEEEARAAGAARMLAVQPEPAVALPTPSELQGEEEPHNPETGEVETDNRGMTEVDETTARELDAQAGAAEEGEGAEPEGEAEAEQNAEPAWKPHVSALRAQIEAATTMPAFARADGKFVAMSAGLPDDVREGLDRALAEKRRAIQAKAA